MSGKITKKLTKQKKALAKFSKKHTSYNKVALVVGFALIATILVAITKASPFTASIEPEDGTKTSCAKVISNANASSGDSVKFGCTASSGFVHPGVFVDKADLDFVKGKIAANQEPWKTAYNSALSSGTTGTTPGSIPVRTTQYKYSALNFQPAPVPSVECTGDKGVRAGIEQKGCFELSDDALAAYTQAILWYYTGNEVYAQNSIKIMNAWSSTLDQILFDQPRFADTNGQIYENGKLEAGWSASNFTRAAEIIRYTYKSPTTGGWSSNDIAAFEKMLIDIHLPLVITGWSGGANWLTTFAEATMGIGIFTNNKSTFDSGVTYWRQKVPTIIYKSSDGAQPFSPHAMFSAPDKMKDYWRKPTSYINGLEGETCRDMSHTMMGMGAMINGAETARIQGIDLYGEEKDRILAGYELNAGYVNQFLDAGKPANYRPSNWVCPNPFSESGTGYIVGYEVALNHYANRKGISMPQTKKLAERLRPSRTGLHTSWETLVKANAP